MVIHATRELLDFVSAEAEWLEEEIPGLAAALAWPESMPTPSAGRVGGSGGGPQTPACLGVVN